MPFHSSKKTKTPSKPSKDTPDPNKLSWWRRTQATRIFLLKWVAPIGFAMALLVLGLRTAAGFVHDLPQFQVNAERLMMDTRPDWLKSSTAREIHRKAFRQQTYSIFDSDLTRRIREEYEADPWVLRVDSVTKIFPNHVKIDLLLRRPLARVPGPLGINLVDSEARVLEVLPSGAGDLCDHLPVVSGLSLPPPARGERWADPALDAGIGVLHVLAANDLFDEVRIADVDLSNFGGRKDPKESEIVLLLPNHVRVLWGRAVGAFGEIPLDQKLDKIRAFLKEGRGVGSVDWNIRFGNGGIIPHP